MRAQAFAIDDKTSAALRDAETYLLRREKRLVFYEEQHLKTLQSQPHLTSTASGGLGGGGGGAKTAANTGRKDWIEAGRETEEEEGAGEGEGEGESSGLAAAKAKLQRATEAHREALSARAAAVREMQDLATRCTMTLHDMAMHRATFTHAVFAKLVQQDATLTEDSFAILQQSAMGRQKEDGNDKTAAAVAE